MAGGPRVVLRRDLSQALRGGHPWIYREALCDSPGLHSGTIVDVMDGHGLFVARGNYDAASPIAVRVLSLDPEQPIDGAFLQRRLSAALSARCGAICPREVSAFRLCNGEGDFLPGVVVDVYGAVAVLRFDGEAARALAPLLVPALLAVGAELSKLLLPGAGIAAPDLGIATVYERSRGGQGVLHAGPAPEDEVQVREHGMKLLVDVVRGQKTGLFLDQRENRRLIRGYAAGRSVWNGFSYTGGFSVQAALGGATRVASVDVAPAALETAQRNFALNGIDPAAHDFYAEDVFVHLRRAIAGGVRHDLVIVDPPSFAPSERSLQRALSAYRDLLSLAMQVVAPGGLLAAASCSSHVDLPAFLEVLGEAAVRVRRPLRLLEVHGQPADHPSLPAFPEGRYLKFTLSRLD